jgi:hypothetical protein
MLICSRGPGGLGSGVQISPLRPTKSKPPSQPGQIRETRAKTSLGSIWEAAMTCFGTSPGVAMLAYRDGRRAGPGLRCNTPHCPPRERVQDQPGATITIAGDRIRRSPTGHRRNSATTTWPLPQRPAGHGQTRTWELPRSGGRKGLGSGPVRATRLARQQFG